MLTEAELKTLEGSEASVAAGKTICANCKYCPDPTECVPDSKHRPESGNQEYLCMRRAPDHIFETRSHAHCNFWQHR